MTARAARGVRGAASHAGGERADSARQHEDACGKQVGRSNKRPARTGRARQGRWRGRLWGYTRTPPRGERGGLVERCSHRSTDEKRCRRGRWRRTRRRRCRREPPPEEGGRAHGTRAREGGGGCGCRGGNRGRNRDRQVHRRDHRRPWLGPPPNSVTWVHGSSSRRRWAQRARAHGSPPGLARGRGRAGGGRSRRHLECFGMGPRGLNPVGRRLLPRETTMSCSRRGGHNVRARGAAHRGPRLRRLRGEGAGARLSIGVGGTSALRGRLDSIA